MVIILVNLPDNINRKEIEDFIRPAIKGGHMGSIAIIIQKNPKTHEIKRHGLVRLTPESIAKRAIEALNKQKLNDKHIEIHEYRTRYWHNDPRIMSTRSSQLRNMRKSDRRQFL